MVLLLHWGVKVDQAQPWHNLGTTFSHVLQDMTDATGRQAAADLVADFLQEPSRYVVQHHTCCAMMRLLALIGSLCQRLSYVRYNVYRHPIFHEHIGMRQMAQ